MEEPNGRDEALIERVTEVAVDSGTNEVVKGIAPIKNEFLTTKEKFHEFLDSKGNVSDNEESKGTKEASVEEPAAKRLKLDPEENKGFKHDGKRVRGQNKSRPHIKPNAYDDNRLCVSVIQNKKCIYGDRCKFFHDAAEYVATKPADIGETCYLYETFGKCSFGPTCRFAKAHTSPDFKSLEKEELVKSYEGRTLVKNSLNKDLQNRLRKRSVAFKKSDEFLKTIAKDRDPGQRHGTGNAASADIPVHREEPQTHSAAASGEEPQTHSAAASGAEPQTHSAAASGEEPQTHSAAASGEEPQTHSAAASGEEPQTHSAAAAEAGTEKRGPVKTIGPLTDADVIKLRNCEKKQVDFRDKLYLAPLTTCGNLPFRRVCKRFGADITCGEMAMCTNLLQGQQSEWALLKRHESEDLFGVQVEGCFPDTMSRCAELINDHTDVDFVDINSGCPIDLVYKKGGGCGLMTRNKKFEHIIKGMNYVLDVPLTVKIRTGVQEKSNIAHKLIPEMKQWGVSMITLHGRSREQRYTKIADWDYINTCSKLASPVPLFGNGDILSYEDAMKARETGVSGVMIARGALIKPWIFTEIKESRHWDISSGERLGILRDFTNYGLEHWGSDTRGVEKTRTFMLEWLSFMCRYIPVGLLERLPQKINERPPYYMGRDYLESIMASQHVGDWVKISEMLLGPVPKNFNFLPKHKANAYK